MQYEAILEKARAWGEEHHPESNDYRHAAFANSVAYLVTGASGGYGGPSMRQHAVSWALIGDGDRLGTIQFPDGRLPCAGSWDFERACQFAEPICYGQLPEICKQISQEEYCFDDDPKDLEALNV